MPQTRYQIGKELEDRVVKYLIEKYGSKIHLARRLPSSKSPVDVICIRDDADFLIQCKRKTSSGDINLDNIFSDPNVVRLTQFPNRYTKVLAMKQPRSRDILFFKWAMPCRFTSNDVFYDEAKHNRYQWVPFIL